MSDDRQHFAATQARLLADLQQETADRPAHARYLAALLAADTDDYTTLVNLTVPPGVSQTVAEALIDDLTWCLAEPPPPGSYCSPYANAYSKHRVDAARRASKRKQTEAQRVAPLADLLRFDPPP